MTPTHNSLWMSSLCHYDFYIWLHKFNMADGSVDEPNTGLISQNTTNNNKNIWLQRFKIHLFGEKKKTYYIKRFHRLTFQTLVFCPSFLPPPPVCVYPAEITLVLCFAIGLMAQSLKYLICAIINSKCSEPSLRHGKQLDKSTILV